MRLKLAGVKLYQQDLDLKLSGELDLGIFNIFGKRPYLV